MRGREVLWGEGASREGRRGFEGGREVVRGEGREGRSCGGGEVVMGEGRL